MEIWALGLIGSWSCWTGPDNTRCERGDRKCWYVLMQRENGWWGGRRGEKRLEIRKSSHHGGQEHLKAWNQIYVCLWGWQREVKSSLKVQNIFIGLRLFLPIFKKQVNISQTVPKTRRRSTSKLSKTKQNQREQMLLEKLELMHTADGNAKWYSCYGKQ